MTGVTVRRDAEHTRNLAAYPRDSLGISNLDCGGPPLVVDEMEILQQLGWLSFFLAAARLRRSETAPVPLFPILTAGQGRVRNSYALRSATTLRRSERAREGSLRTKPQPRTPEC